MPTDNPPPARRRERSNRYPGVPLADAIELAGFVETKGLDGLPAGSIAVALGFSNIKSNAFSARLSAARQFGLLTLTGDGYALTDLARAILHPVDPASLPTFHRRALLESPLYAELAVRFAGKPVPEAPALANLLYHHHNITASAKEQAAEVFLESARFAGVLDDQRVFRPEGAAEPSPAPKPNPAPKRSKPGRVRIDLALWDRDAGETIRVRSPESISRASFERFLQAFRLHVRIEDDPPSSSG